MEIARLHVKIHEASEFDPVIGSLELRRSSDAGMNHPCQHQRSGREWPREFDLHKTGLAFLGLTRETDVRDFHPSGIRLKMTLVALNEKRGE